MADEYDGGYIRSLGGLAFDVVVHESETATVRVTDHQIESGASVSDHAYMEPKEVELEIGQGSIDSEGDPREMLDALRALQERREPVEIYTGKTYYPTMLITGIMVNTDRTTEHVLMATVRCREVRIVETSEVDASHIKEAPKKRQKTPQKTKATADRGTQNAQPVEDTLLNSTKNSVLGTNTGYVRGNG